MGRARRGPAGARLRAGGGDPGADARAHPGAHARADARAHPGADARAHPGADGRARADRAAGRDADAGRGGERRGPRTRRVAVRGGPGMSTDALFADRYRLERRLGVGGMATVQLAFDTRLERYVAVK